MDDGQAIKQRNIDVSDDLWWRFKTEVSKRKMLVKNAFPQAMEQWIAGAREYVAAYAKPTSAGLSAKDARTVELVAEMLASNYDLAETVRVVAKKYEYDKAQKDIQQKGYRSGRSAK